MFTKKLIYVSAVVLLVFGSNMQLLAEEQESKSTELESYFALVATGYSTSTFG